MLSYTYGEVPWEDKLFIGCNGIEVTKKDNWFGDDEYTLIPIIHVFPYKLW